MSWSGYIPLPLPEDQEAAFITAWTVAASIGLGIGLLMVRRHHWRRMAIAGALFVLCLTAFAIFDQRRIITVVRPGSTVTLVLPLLACPGAENYWPGGRMRAVAMAEDVRELRERQPCLTSTLLGNGPYLTLSSTLVALAATLIGGAGLILSRQEKALDAIAALISRWQKP